MSSLLDYLFSFLPYYFRSNNTNLQPEQEIDRPRPRAKLITWQPRFFKDISVDQAVNFYYLSLIKEDNDWSIHGLWPQTDVNKYPQFCKKVNFDIRKLNPIIDQLKEKWYSNRGSDEDFWKHEYEKHGSCNFNNLNELEYFQKTLDLFCAAKKKNLPEYFYNEKTGKCLIPVNKQFDFFSIIKEFVY